MIKNFVKFVNDNGLKVDSAMITADGKSYRHDFVPCARRNIRSLSKIISCLGVSKAIDNQLFSIDSNVMPFFEDIEIYNEKNLEYLSKLKIKHLLTLSIGNGKSFMLKRDYRSLPVDTNNIEHIFNQDMVYEPGTFLVYDNAATYLLSAIVEIATGKPFDDWTYETVLQHLEISKPKWEKCNQGICLGATGLYLGCEEVHKIGLLLLNKGKYGDKQIINREWIDSMHEPHIINADFDKYNIRHNKLKKIAYGYHIWVCRNGNGKHTATHYFGDGAEGKFLIISPDQNMVITVLSRERNMDLIADALSKYL